MLTWPIISAGKSKRPTFTAKAIANYGRRLRVAGVRSSPRRVRRVMGENGWLAPHRVGRNQEKMHDGTIVTDKVDEMWGTDMSQTVTLKEGRAYVSWPSNTRTQKSSAFTPRVQPIASRRWSRSGRGCMGVFGSIAPGVARGLKLRHDHGSNYMSGDFQDEIKCLGIEASPSFVREPEGNGVAERFIRTLKENLLWVRTFKTIEDLRAELVAFARRYNETWLVARHGYKTPARVREEQTMPRLVIDPTLAATLPLAAEQAQPGVSKPCRTTVEMVCQALVGNYREEHVFALTQALELYEVYQTKVTACDEQIEAILKRLKKNAPPPASKLLPVRQRTHQPNAPAFDARGALHAILGVDLTQINGLGPYLALKLVGECGTNLAAWPTAKHFTSWLGLAPHNKISGGKVLSSKTRRTSNRAASLLRLAAGTVGRTDTALGAFYRRLSARVGKAKAITVR